MLAALPKSDATLAITVYDSSNLPLAEFAGTLNPHGAVSGMSRADYGDKGEHIPDVELLSALTFPNAAGAAELSLSLQGVDAYEVAYAEIAVTEGKTTTTTEVGWGSVGAVWEGTLSVEHSGLIEVKATGYDRGFCSNGTCVALAQDDAGVWPLSATAYSAKSTDLPTAVKVSLTSTLKAAVPLETTTTLTSGTSADVVFANAVELSQNPLGIDLAGEVSVLGAANKKGKQEALAKGKFYGTLGISRGGKFSLSGADKDEVQPKGDILIGGEPIDFELIDNNGDGTVEAPPVVMFLAAGNGKGTRAFATANNGTPGLL